MSKDKLEVNKLSYGDAENRMRYFEGTILTIIDAVIADKQQNKATKDLIKGRFCNCLNELWKVAIGEWPSVFETGEKSPK